MSATGVNQAKVVAIIPARGGSKRVPGKNILDFFGKPMIAWTIEAARKSQLFDRIIVSTDDPVIARVAIEFGAEVPFLRTTAADDLSPVSEATLAALEQLEEQGHKYKTVVQLFAVCPLRDEQEIINAYTQFAQQPSDFLISCFVPGMANPYLASSLNPDQTPAYLFPDLWAGKQQLRDMPPLYIPSGAIWIANTEALKSAGTFYGPGHIYWPINWKSAIDIDTYADIELAQAAYLVKHSRLAKP